MTKKKFNINDYPGKYAIHCDTEEKAKVFCKYLDSVGKVWNDGVIYTDRSFFNKYDSDTVYNFNMGLFGYFEYYVDQDYTILEFDDFDWSGWEEEKKSELYKTICRNAWSGSW